MLVSVNSNKINKALGKGSVIEVDREQQVFLCSITEEAGLALSSGQLHRYLSRVPSLCMWEASL